MLFFKRTLVPAKTVPEPVNVTGPGAAPCSVRIHLLAGATIFALLLAACSGQTTDNAAVGTSGAAMAPLNAKAVVDTRRKNFKELGAAFKTISDEAGKSSPNVAAIAASADRVKTYAMRIGDWFPAGSGPESGAKTRALPGIWEDRATFDAALAKLQDEAGKLQAAAAGGDIGSVTMQFLATAEACKTCHDAFLMSKE